MEQQPEAWMRGPVPGVEPLLMPAAHALIGAAEDMRRAAEDLSVELLWSQPGGAASVGFHIAHAAGSLDRLLTYARNEALSPEQFAYLSAEQEPGDPPRDAAALLAHLYAQVERALAQIRATPLGWLLEYRGIGRKQLPSNVLGLLFHAAEHTQRHTGQAVTTARIVRGLRSD
ncbi:MAG TPA: DinB family protein [Longimicrobium sp.]|jgi:hypothetical protein|uniref:DinB family protein n=1 Tax=Longimicrobium sp. TaxID=2029185 RepID=UPI002EDB2831